ncbi:MAG: hypothetical protein HWD84_09305 [Flavobacteriaceae bacterium]|nr:hypothetical protein [Flavobacteriaceae bacterium]
MEHQLSQCELYGKYFAKRTGNTDSYEQLRKYGINQGYTTFWDYILLAEWFGRNKYE